MLLEAEKRVTVDAVEGACVMLACVCVARVFVCVCVMLGCVYVVHAYVCVCGMHVCVYVVLACVCVECLRVPAPCLCVCARTRLRACASTASTPKCPARGKTQRMNDCKNTIVHMCHCVCVCVLCAGPHSSSSSPASSGALTGSMTTKEGLTTAP